MIFNGPVFANRCDVMFDSTFSEEGDDMFGGAFKLVARICVSTALGWKVEDLWVAVLLKRVMVFMVSIKLNKAGDELGRSFSKQG